MVNSNNGKILTVISSRELNHMEKNIATNGLGSHIVACKAVWTNWDLYPVFWFLRMVTWWLPVNSFRTIGVRSDICEDISLMRRAPQGALTSSCLFRTGGEFICFQIISPYILIVSDLINNSPHGAVREGLKRAKCCLCQLFWPLWATTNITTASWWPGAAIRVSLSTRGTLSGQQGLIPNIKQHKGAIMALSSQRFHSDSVKWKFIESMRKKFIANKQHNYSLEKNPIRCGHSISVIKATKA